MYVIRVRIGDDLPWYYLHGFALGRVLLSRSFDKAWCFNTRGEAFSMAASIDITVYNLEPLLTVQAVSTDDEDLIDFDAPFSYEYLLVDEGD